MSRGRNQSGGGVLGVLGLLFVISLIVKYIWWIVGAVAIVATFYIGRAVVREFRAAEAEAARRDAAIAARADQQHEWVLGGDPRGIYGERGAELMRLIEAEGVERAPRRLPDSDR